MKDLLTNANFPMSADGRVYHVGIKAGEAANRVITVGDPARARRIASHFDAPPYEYLSGRGFLTLTGKFKNVPVTVIAINMGFSNVDFFVRELRAVTRGDLVIVRLGSCGSLDPSLGIGSIVVPSTAYCVLTNYDFFHPDTDPKLWQSGEIEPYTLTKPISGDRALHDQLKAALERTMPEKATLTQGRQFRVKGDTLDASADSFYSSQGRADPQFFDANANLVSTLLARRPGTATFEMETAVLYHLAWLSTLADRLRERYGGELPNAGEMATPKDEDRPVPPKVRGEEKLGGEMGGTIRAGAVQIVFANRTDSGFITPDEVSVLESWAGLGVLEALAGFDIPEDRLHPAAGSVWA